MPAFNAEARDNLAVRTSDGATLSYWTAGDGPRTLLLLHGWGGSGSGRFWTPLLQRLDLSGIRVITADLRGHGKSDQVRLGFSTETFAKDMFAVLEHAGAKHPIVIGYSMSAKWVQWMSSMEPERVAGQILIAPAPALALPLTDDILNDWLRAARDRPYFEAWLRQFIKHPLARRLWMPISRIFRAPLNTACEKRSRSAGRVNSSMSYPVRGVRLSVSLVCMIRCFLHNSSERKSSTAFPARASRCLTVVMRSRLRNHSKQRL